MLGVAVRKPFGTGQTVLDRCSATRLDIGVGQLAQRGEERLPMTSRLGDGESLVQHRGALLVASAHRVHKRGAERD